MGTVITFAGPETFLLEEQAKKYFDASVAKYGEMNVLRIDPSSMDLLTLKTHLFSLPFFGTGKRVIFLSPFPGESGGKGEGKNKNDEIVALLQNLPEELVVICLAPNPDRRTKAWKSLSALADPKVSKEFTSLTGLPLTEWVIKHVEKMGARILPSAAEYLWQYTGTDLWKLHQEIAKLALFQQDKPISERDIREITTPSFETIEFALSDAFSKGKENEIRQVFQRLIEGGENPLTLLFRDFSSILRHLLLARFAVDEGKTASQVGLHPFVFQRIKASAMKFPLPHLKTMQEKLVSIDEGVKTGLVSFAPGKEELLVMALEKWLTEFFCFQKDSPQNEV